jgi:hypothetical protein
MIQIKQTSEKLSPPAELFEARVAVRRWSISKGTAALSLGRSSATPGPLDQRFIAKEEPRQYLLELPELGQVALKRESRDEN